MRDKDNNKNDTMVKRDIKKKRLTRFWGVNLSFFKKNVN